MLMKAYTEKKRFKKNIIQSGVERGGTADLPPEALRPHH